MKGSILITTKPVGHSQHGDTSIAVAAHLEHVTWADKLSLVDALVNSLKFDELDRMVLITMWLDNDHILDEGVHIDMSAIRSAVEHMRNADHEEGDSNNG